MVTKYLNFSWAVKNLLACFSQPTEQLHITYLKERDIYDVISLTEQLPEVTDERIKFYHIPVTDYTPPTIDQIKLAVRLIQDNLNDSKVLDLF